MDSKHTPGPWQWLGWGIATLTGSNGERVLSADGHPSEADLALIAAAPELLEALEDMMGWSGATGTYSAPRFAEAAEKATAAIAKATGGGQ